MDCLFPSLELIVLLNLFSIGLPVVTAWFIICPKVPPLDLYDWLGCPWPWDDD